MPHFPLGATVTTGEQCPETGLWSVIGRPETAIPIAKGDLVPPYEGKPVTWQFVRRA